MSVLPFTDASALNSLVNRRLALLGGLSLSTNDMVTS